VQKDRTVSLNGVVYEVDATLVGETVALRFDPQASAGRPIQVSHAGLPVTLAKPLDAYANCFVKRQRPSHTLQPDTPPPEPPKSRLALRDLQRRDDATSGTRSSKTCDCSPITRWTPKTVSACCWSA
jgi:hypothetical protein